MPKDFPPGTRFQPTPTPEWPPRIHLFVIKHETVWQSILADAFTLIALFSGIGAGRLIGSAVLEWLAAALFVVAIIIMSLTRDRRLSIDEARHRLDEIEQERKGNAP